MLLDPIDMRILAIDEKRSFKIVKKILTLE